MKSRVFLPRGGKRKPETKAKGQLASFCGDQRRFASAFFEPSAFSAVLYGGFPRAYEG